MKGVSPRIILWLLALALILGFGWYKSYENRADRERREAWELRRQRLQAESQQEYKRLVDWLRSVHSQPGGRQQIMEKLPGGDEFQFHDEGRRQATSWTHPEYGIQLQLGFEDDQLTSIAASAGEVAAVYPMPEQMATSSRAEAVRNVAVAWGAWLWLGLLLVALASRSHGLAAAEAALAAALVCGTAWAVSPYYTLTPRGIFSHDRLIFAALKFLGSLVILAIRMTPLMTRAERPRGPQFSLRTLLAVMGLTAVLLAIGPLGYLAICVFAVGGVFFLVVVQVSLSAWQPTWKR
jgi:hypothetical protein